MGGAPKNIRLGQDRRRVGYSDSHQDETVQTDDYVIQYTQHQNSLWLFFSALMVDTWKQKGLEVQIEELDEEAGIEAKTLDRKSVV